MKKVYRTSPLMYAAAAVSAVSMLLIFWSERDTVFRSGFYLFLVVVEAVPVAAMTAFLFFIARIKIVVDDEKITSVGFMRTVSIPHSRIKGYRVIGDSVAIIPAIPGMRKIRISRFLNNHEALEKLIRKKFRNVEEASAVSGQNASDATDATDASSGVCGACDDILRSRIRAINIVSIAAGIILCFLWNFDVLPPVFRKSAIAVCCGIPLLGIFMFRSFNGAVTLSFRDAGMKRPSLLPTLIAPSIALMMGIHDNYFRIYSYANIWKPAVCVVAVLVLLVFFRPDRSGMREARRVISPGGIIPFILLYSYGFITATNFSFCPYNPVRYAARVLDKTVSHSSEGSDSYYLNLGEWGPDGRKGVSAVSTHAYFGKNTGDIVGIDLYPGLYGIPYYVIDGTITGDRESVGRIDRIAGDEIIAVFSETYPCSPGDILYAELDNGNISFRVISLTGRSAVCRILGDDRVKSSRVRNGQTLYYDGKASVKKDRSPVHPEGNGV